MAYALTRRRSSDAREECWHVYYGDVHVRTIAIRTGSPHSWECCCGFYPASRPALPSPSTKARADFGRAWQVFLAKRTDANFTAFRRRRAMTAWKYAMGDGGCRMPTQTPNLRSRCFCGAEIGVACEEHVYTSQPWKPRVNDAQRVF
jgi:hypothetical protein